MTIRVKAPGSCGELVQGMIDGKNFLITCPIDMYSEVEIDYRENCHHRSEPKALAAVKKTAYYLGTELTSFQLTVRSELLVGKGMASSSADISAACQATALLLGRELNPDEIADIALTIEPTDGIFYPGIMMFDHVNGYIRRYLGTPPDIAIAVFDLGGEVDTVNFNKRQELLELNREKEPMVLKAVKLATEGLARKDCRMIGEGATLSAQANQRILYKPWLDTFVKLTPKFKAIGVCIAHSGTVMGVMFSAHNLSGHRECVDALQSACHGEINYLKTVRLISGGLIRKGDNFEQRV